MEQWSYERENLEVVVQIKRTCRHKSSMRYASFASRQSIRVRKPFENRARVWMVSCPRLDVEHVSFILSYETIVLVHAANDRKILQVSNVAFELFGASRKSLLMVTLYQNAAQSKIRRQSLTLS